MAKQAKQLPVSDPHSIPEAFCDGPINVTISSSNIATLTFTHLRPDPKPLFAGGATEPIAVVRARVSTPFQNLVALRDLLNGMIKTEATPGTATASPTKH